MKTLLKTEKTIIKTAEIETMTKMIKSINAMTNTVNKKYQNAETTTCTEIIDESTMTLVETEDALTSTDDLLNKPCEAEVQTETKKYTNSNIETEEVIVLTKQELDSLLEQKNHPELVHVSTQTMNEAKENSDEFDNFDDMVVEEMESEPVETHHVVPKHSNDDDMIKRIEEIKKEYSEHGIQTTVEYETNGIQTSLKVIEKDLYDELLAKNQTLIKKNAMILTDKEQEISNLKSKELSLKQQLEKNDESINGKTKLLKHQETLLRENDANIHNLSNKIQTLEQEIDEQKDQIERLSGVNLEQENQLNEERSKLDDLTKTVDLNTEKLINIKKDLTGKTEQYNSKVEENKELSSKHSSLEKNYTALKHEYSKVQKENEMLVSKAAELHIQLENLSIKNKKYKKQLVMTTEDVKTKLKILKEQKEKMAKLMSENTIFSETNVTLKSCLQDLGKQNQSQKDLVSTQIELIKVKALLKEKEDTVSKLLVKDSKDKEELKVIIEDSYKVRSESEKQVIQQKLKEQREELEMQLNQKINTIQDLEEKFSKAQIKIHECKIELTKVMDNRILKQNKKFKDEKKLIIKTLNEKNTKIDKLEKEIESWKIKYSSLENFLQGDQKEDYAKLQNLVKNVNQVKQMYSQIVKSESVKQEKDILSKKMKRKEVKIKQLNDELGVTRSQVMKYKNKINQLYSELSKYRKVKDENGSFIQVNDIDKGIKPDSVKPTEGIVKSRKGGKNKTDKNTISFQDLIQMSTLKRSNSMDNDEIKEQDEEDEEDFVQT